MVYYQHLQINLDEETINKLPKSIKILSNFAVGFGNIDLEAAKKEILLLQTPLKS